ncbi:hypothetical protein Y032_0187g1102 [Ancylostoma ceylanicum]|uniref:Uncharacterized protein n=1 Tax=Ancylostoma ceylanicum TaxID=53326 RepID=A0A016SRN4_9BILA|nr:hypothetical protein Y032_0187g1102 [Ancylostoma ceylanicum]
MDNPSRSVCLIENAIDRLIEYGDRIHAAYRRQHPEVVRQKVLLTLLLTYEKMRGSDISQDCRQVPHRHREAWGMQVFYILQ